MLSRYSYVLQYNYTVVLALMPLLHNYYFFVVRTFKFWSLNSFEVHNAALLTLITMAYS